jgi:hypothetical protein
MNIPARFPRSAGKHFFAIAAAFVFLASEVRGAGENLVANGGFEDATSQQELLWDGVDGDGYLAGNKATVLAVAASGTKKIPMPISVCVADVNADGLLDLVTADPYGIIRAYINSGTKTEPKFTHCEIVPVFLTRGGERGMAPKISLFDWGKRGMLDLVVGNYAGEVFFLSNSGSKTAPDFRQPDDIAKILLATSAGGRLWGNLFAPVAYDWNNDGKVDLLLGEGGYSANAVHLLLNRSASSHPEFSDNERYYLAYGDGRELLVPTVADFNGDGFPDLLVADSEGKVGVYLNPGGSWKPGVELPFSQFVRFGSMESFNSPITICAADINGDGLFDLIIGKDNGRVAVAINHGTKEQPKFDPPVEIKGTPIWGRSVNRPANWSVSEGVAKGNMYAYISVVDATEDPNAAPPEGKHVLKVAYYESPNQVFKKPALITSGDRNYYAHTFATDVSAASNNTPGNYFIIRTMHMPPLNVGSTYTLSFKFRGQAVKEAQYMLAWSGYTMGVAAKIERGERGSATVTGGNISEDPSDRNTFNVTGKWSTFTKDIRIEFKNPELRDLKQTVPNFSPGADGNYSKISATLEFRIVLTPNQGVFYLDDVKVVEKK